MFIRFHGHGGRMAAGRPKFAFVGEDIYDICYPHPKKKLSKKDFIIEFVSIYI